MSRNMKLAAMTAAACLLLLLVAALAAALIIRMRVDPNDYKADIIKLVQERHQRTLSIPGTIALTFYPRVGADLGRVTLSEHASAEQFAAIDQARVSVALWPLLLRQQVVIDRIDVRGIRARVVRHADGSMNTGDLTAARPAATAGTGADGGRARLEVAISSIRVGGAHVRFEDRKRARVLDISHLNIDSGPIARGTPSRVALSAHVAINRPALTTALTLTARFMPSLQQRQVAFSEVDAHLDLSFKDTRVKLAGKLDVDLDRDEFAAQLKGSFDDSVFDLDSALRDGRYKLTMHVDQLDLGRYQNRLVPDALPDDPAILEAGDAFDLSPLAMLRADGGLHIAQLKVGSLHARNVRAALRSGGGKFVLQPIGASLYGGAGTGAVTFDFARSASTPHMTFVASLTGIDVAPLLHDMLGKTPIAGRGDVAIDVNTQGASTAQMRQAMAGTAAVRLSEGALHGIDIGRMIARAKGAAGAAASADKTGFARLDASFTIADGVAHNADLALQAPLFQVAGAGDIDLGREELEYTLACTLGATGLTLPLHISGPWDALTWRLDTGAVSGETMRRKASDKLEQAIRGILKR
ncbi:AsmA family protein [Massilia sp. PAMC28688]|uniref:AsmA family protein n=1 Tax=Massilia sp. PAMC28688 TaxID=2861283 RepID=UPI001C63215F|nr:AsmA family protein [Massilia sp. PAMC28688]QYF95398.1 AsmA family protein [Massilia sp. PAMC28688]